MVAIYARQSVDRADSISIDSQIEFCKHEAGGETFQIYQDRGYSGKNVDRPSFVEMMAAIENGMVTKVVVYKLDRISRSILDFSAMMERFERRRVEFVSTTEKFDTATPMGRAMLNICIVFAQLERETIQKRIADAYYSRSQRSLYMGGRVPYGFRLEPTVIDAIHTAKYQIIPEEARQIQLIYELYAQPEYSYGAIVAFLQANGITKNGKPWARSRLAELLRNPIYVQADLAIYTFYRDQGAIVVNDPADFVGTNGCYCYKGKDTAGRKQTSLAGSHLVLAPHQGIVPAALWLQCRNKCLAGKQVSPRQNATNTWLAGKIKCGLCGYALVGKQYHDRQARYFFCSNRMNTKACPGPGTIHADNLEALVSIEIQKKLAQFEHLCKQRRLPANAEQTALQAQLLQTESEIEALMGRLSTADDVLYHYICQRMDVLDAKKRALGCQLSTARLRQSPGSAEISSHVCMWERLSFSDKRLVVDHLIKKSCSGRIVFYAAD